MDVWVVAAAAGAGYVAQRLKNIRRGRHDSLNSSSDNLIFLGPESSSTIEEVQDKSHHFNKFMPSTSSWEEGCKIREQAFEVPHSRMASTGAFDEENCVTLNNFASFSRVSNANSLPDFRDDKAIQWDMETRVPFDIDEDIASDSVPEPSSRSIGFSYSCRSRTNIRSRRIKSQFIKPQTSLESCVMAQLYCKNAEFEEYTYSVHSTPTVRPFVVTDGSRILSRVPHEPFSEPFGMTKCELLKDTYAEETVYGVPKLHSIQAKTETGNEKVLKRSKHRKAVDGNTIYSQGSSNGALFHFGLTMGIFCSVLANKLEMEKLNRLLRQTENLVQDLQEELEMKDSLTVKELAVEDYELQDVDKDSQVNGVACELSLKQKTGYSSRCDDEECAEQKDEDESLREIEAELEAELERLESNINSSRLEGKSSNATELDPFVSDVVRGELRADLFDAKNGSEPDSNRDVSGGSTPHSVRYPVSPRQLTLKLHEVIQSRLEERIKELTTELQHCQRKIKLMESGHVHPREVPLLQNSPITREEHEQEQEQCLFDQPVVINLSGDALSAYSEAYKELTNVSETDEEDLPFSGFEKDEHHEIFHQCKQVIDQVQDGGSNGFRERFLISDGTPKTGFDYQVSNGDGRYVVSNEGSEDGEDEMERLLIRQIVEKAKQGSPAVLNAKRALLLTDAN